MTAAIQPDAHGNLTDSCGHCVLVPTVTGYVRGTQIACPVHGSPTHTTNPNTTPEEATMTDETIHRTRTVYSEPRYDKRDRSLTYAEQEPAGVRWDLAFGCNLSFGRFENAGPFRVTISMSDREAAAGICVREVTAEQVREYAQNLLRLVRDEQYPPACATGGCHDGSAVLVDGEPRCVDCAELMDPQSERREHLANVAVTA